MKISSISSFVLVTEFDNIVKYEKLLQLNFDMLNLNESEKILVKKDEREISSQLYSFVSMKILLIIYFIYK